MKRLQPISIQLKGILTVSVLRSLTMAMLSPIFALYLKQFVHTDFAVSLVYTISYLMSFVATIYGSVIVSYLQKRKTMIVALLFFSAVSLAFTFSSTSHSVVFLFILYTFLYILIFFAISLYIDKLSSTTNLATHFGENGTLTNMSWIVGPMLGGFIASALSYTEVFLLASLFALLALLIFVFSEPIERRYRHHHHIYIFKNIKSFFKKTTLRKTYAQGLGFCIFYGASALTPLFFEQIGSTVSQIGLFLGLSAIPWIVLEFPVGKWADKTKNEGKLFVATYAILIPALILFGLSKLPLLAFLFLTFTSIATALSETTILSHFYRHVPKNDVENSSVFLTYPSLGIFLGTLFSSLMLTFTSLNILYITLGIFLIPFLINAIRMKPSPAKANN